MQFFEESYLTIYKLACFMLFYMNGHLCWFYMYMFSEM